MRFNINLKDVMISVMFLVGGLALIFLDKFVNMNILGIFGSIFFWVFYIFQEPY